MTKFILDTHTLLWLADESGRPRIPAPAVEAMSDARADLLISAVSLWEISLKHWLGKLPEGELFLTRWSFLAPYLKSTILPLNDKHAILAGRLNWPHKDPFDRMLAAQAILEDATLVSRDAAFDAVAGVRRLWGASPAEPAPPSAVISRKLDRGIL